MVAKQVANPQNKHADHAITTEQLTKVLVKWGALSVTPRGVAVVCFHGNISVIIWKWFDLCTEILVATMLTL